jgi:hypothetical protein
VTIAIFLVYLNCVLMILKPFKVKFNVLFLYWAIFYLLYVSILHYPVPSTQSDLEIYTNYFTSKDGVPFWLIGTEFKHYREFLYHFTSRLLYLIVEDRFLTFLLLDIVLGIFVFKYFLLLDLKNNKLGYLLFGILLFFPILCGYQSIYRQLFSIILFLLSTSYIQSGKKKIGVSCFIISIFFHNSSALFFPVILLFLNKRNYSIIGLLIVYIALNIASSKNSELFYREEVFYGNTVAVTFVIIFLFILLFTIFSDFNKIDKYSVDIIILSSVIYIIGFFSLDSNLLIERIGFFSFSIIYYPCSKFFDCIRPKIVSRICFFHLSILPILVFYNSWLFH